MLNAQEGDQGNPPTVSLRGVTFPLNPRLQANQALAHQHRAPTAGGEEVTLVHSFLSLSATELPPRNRRSTSGSQKQKQAESRISMNSLRKPMISNHTERGRQTHHGSRLEGSLQGKRGTPVTAKPQP